MKIEPKEIWLEPWCEKCEDKAVVFGRGWEKQDLWKNGCADCDRQSVRYRLVPKTGEDWS